MAVALRCVLAILFVVHSYIHAKTFYFPHYGDGDGLGMTFVVSNHSDAVASGQLSVYDTLGNPAPLPFENGADYVVDLTLAPNSSTVLRTLGTSDPLRTGFVSVELDQEEVSGVAIFRFASGLEASVLPSQTGKRFALFVERSSNLDTGIAIYRETSTPINLKLYDASGTLVRERPFDFPGFQAARFLTELFPDLTGGFQGSLVVESEGSFALLGLRLGGGLLSTIPVVPLAQGSQDNRDSGNPYAAWNRMEPESWWRESAPYSCSQEEKTTSPWLSAGLTDLGGSDSLSLIRYFGNGSYLRYGNMGFTGCTRLEKYPNGDRLDPPADPTYYSLGDLDIWIDVARVPSDAAGWHGDDGTRVDMSMEQAVELLNRYVAPYFRRISQDNLRITFLGGNEFNVAGDGGPEAAQVQQYQLVGACLDGCKYGAPGGLNRILVNDVASDTGGAAYNGWARFGLASFQGAYMETIVHEMGHAWMGWPHSFSEVPWRSQASGEISAPNPYSNLFDIMSSLALSPISGWDHEMPSTLAINRYSAGWINPEDVALHLVDSATYTLSRPRESGTQFLVVHSGRPNAFTTLEVLEERSAQFMADIDVYDPAVPGNYRPRRFEGVLVSRYDQTAGTGTAARVGPALYHKENPESLDDVNLGRDDHSLLSDGETREIGGGVRVDVRKNPDGSFDVTVSGGKVAEFEVWCDKIWFSDEYDAGCFLDSAVWDP